MAYNQNLVNARGAMPGDIPSTPTLASNQNIPAGQPGSPWTAITSDQLKPAQAVQVPTSQPNSTQSDSLVAGVASGIPSLQETISSLTPQETSLDTTQNALISRLNELLPQSGGKTQALAQEQQNAGIPALQKQLQDLNGQITVGNAEYTKLAADAEAKKAALEANSRGLTTSVLAGQQGAVERQALAERAVKAAELGMQAARAQAVSGNINTALQIAQNAVNAKYAPIEDELKIRQAQLESIQPLLEKQDKQQALAQQVYLQKQAQAVADQKDKEKAIQNIMVQAAQSGADQATLDKIQRSATPTDAIAAAGYTLGAEFRAKMVQQKFENDVQLAQLAISKAQVGVSQGNLALSRERLAFEKTKEAFDQAVKLDPTIGQAGAKATPVMQQSLSKSNIDLIGSLLTDKGLNSSVGPNYFARFSVVNQLSGAKSNFIAGIEQLRSQLNLDTLIKAKANGATFGALSDNELQVLASAATKLGTWATKDKEGHITGYAANEKDFRKELDKINNFAKLDYVLKGGKPEDVNIKQMSDGTYWTQNSDGTFTQLE